MTLEAHDNRRVRDRNQCQQSCEGHMRGHHQEVMFMSVEEERTDPRCGGAVPQLSRMAGQRAEPASLRIHLAILLRVAMSGSSEPRT